MRTKIDYGIDLGTTNSAIARMENGIPVIKKSDTQAEILPSCVHFNRKKICMVGDTARSAMTTDFTRALKNFQKLDSNTFIEFKRTMGTDHLYHSEIMGKEYSSDELSSEVIKTLKSFIQDEDVSSLVITVPAKFLNPQKEATIRAAKLAGCNQVELLQEPVAASTAFGLSSKIKQGYWIVFDFGGGTFDSALVKSEDGILTVKDTEGDNWLGGKNLDEAIVDQIIIPYLDKNYSLKFILDNVTKKEMLRNALKEIAEKTKIQLSFKESDALLSNLGDFPFVDENGDEPEIDLIVTQKELEIVVAPFFQKAINITKDLIKRNNLKGSDLAALILIGGPTYSPILRRMLKEQITDKIDTSENPMTAVAKGAALFASTLSLSEEEIEKVRDKTKIQLEIKYDPTTVETEVMVSIKILKDKTEGDIPLKVFAEIVRSEGDLSSGKKQISEKASLFDLQLLEGRSNVFDIFLFDELGNRLECQPNQINILQGIGVNDMTTLPYNICIVKHFYGDEKDLILPVKNLSKNKKIPATGVINGLKTRKTIRPGMKEDVIRIPIYQGNYDAERTNPKLNHFINEVIISGESIPALLQKGSEVNITIKIDRSEHMRFIADFPAIDYNEELDIEIKNIETPSEEFLKNELDLATEQADNLNAKEILNSLELLRNDLENKKGSADGMSQILSNLREELFKLDKFEKHSEWPKLEMDLKETFFNLEDLLLKIKEHQLESKLDMNKINNHIIEIRKKVEHIIKEKSSGDAKELISDINIMDINIRNLVTNNALDLDYLNMLDKQFHTYNWEDKNRARSLINEGLNQSRNGNNAGIRNFLIEIIKLLPEDEKPKDTLS